MVMEGDWLSSIRTLVETTKHDFDKLCKAKLDDYHGIANNVLTQKRLLQNDQDELQSKRQELARLTDRLKSITPQLEKTKQDVKEVNTCLNLAELKLVDACRQIDVITQRVDGLRTEVVQLEYEKENRSDNFKKKFDDLFKAKKFFKKMLDMRIEWDQPDLYKIWFSKSGKNLPHMVLRSTDLKSWEVMEVDNNPTLRDELNDEFVETRNIMNIMVRARKIILNKRQEGGSGLSL